MCVSRRNGDGKAGTTKHRRRFVRVRNTIEYIQKYVDISIMPGVKTAVTEISKLTSTAISV